MIASLAYAVIAAGLLLAAWTGWWAARHKPANAGQIVGMLVFTAALAVQSGIGLVRLIGGAPIAEPVTFVAYAIGVLAPPALGVYLARIERTRWGSLSLCFTAVVAAVMTLRLLQLWRMGVTGV